MVVILNTGARTDTVQYFTPWLLKRFEEGYVLSRNPLFPNKVTRYELTPDKVDVVVFCSKNYRPILPHLHKITSRFRTYFHYTITAYGKDIEPGVPSIDESIETLYELERIVGKERICWRYDPVLLTPNYTVETHRKTFEYMAGKISGHVDRCTFSFVEIYNKLRYNMPELIPFSQDEMHEIAESIGSISRRHGLWVQTCGTREDYSRFGIHKSGCMTLKILGDANGVEFRDLKHRGIRNSCGCMEARSIGDYDTCINGCKYCYANKNPQKARENFKLHDPDSPLLLGDLKEGDEVVTGNQVSYLKRQAQDVTLDLFAP